jgi:hypothetical protein
MLRAQCVRAPVEDLDEIAVAAPGPLRTGQRELPNRLLSCGPVMVAVQADDRRHHRRGAGSGLDEQRLHPVSRYATATVLLLVPKSIP